METQKIEKGISKLSLLKNDFKLFNNAGSYVNCFRMYFGYFIVLYPILLLIAPTVYIIQKARLRTIIKRLL